jgi:ketosteroid isomerase-like protein
MPASKRDQIRAIAPPDGTDLVELFATAGPAIDTGGLVAEDAAVRFVAPSAENERQGPEGFREGWADWLEAWQSYRMYYDDVVEKDDRVVALVRLSGVTRRDGVEMEQEAAAVFRFDGAKVVEIEFNLDRDDALAD